MCVTSYKNNSKQLQAAAFTVCPGSISASSKPVHGLCLQHHPRPPTRKAQKQRVSGVLTGSRRATQALVEHTRQQTAAQRRMLRAGRLQHQA